MRQVYALLGGNIPLSRKFYVLYIYIYIYIYICIICTKDMKSIRSAKLHLIISTVKFHTQFEEKTVVSNPSDILN